MLEINVALDLVLQHCQLLPPKMRAANASLGLQLRETIKSDVDSPPHDKSIVDGYAIRSADVNELGAALNYLEEVTAGRLPTKHITPGTATRIMTGATIPAGADAVVMVEKTNFAEDNTVVINEFPVKSGQNIMRRGASMRRGDELLSPGVKIRPIELGVLAEVGRKEVLITPRPRVAILATGDELVPVEQKPSPGQIRNSNGSLLEGLVQQAGGIPENVGIACDDPMRLRMHCEKCLALGDVIVLSGGVSAGVLDLVPKVLGDLGVRQVFHKINLKPGKPLWFGVHEGYDTPRLVFGLPGNPVSTLVCFELFVRPAIARLAGWSDGGLREITAALGSDYHHRGGRVTFYPAAMEMRESKLIATPLPWRGSGDLRTLLSAQALIHFAGDERLVKAGDEVKVRMLGE